MKKFNYYFRKPIVWLDEYHYSSNGIVTVRKFPVHFRIHKPASIGPTTHFEVQQVVTTLRYHVVVDLWIVTLSIKFERDVNPL